MKSWTLATKLRHLQLHSPGLRVQRALIAAGPRILAPCAALMPASPTQPVRFSIQQCIHGFLSGATHPLALQRL